ncbi:MAG: penicillin-binding protein activator [Parashewanella sp.]
MNSITTYMTTKSETVLKSQAIVKFVIVFMCCNLLFACSSTTSKKTPEAPVSLEFVNQSAAQYLNQAKLSTNKVRENKLWLLAIAAELNNHQTESAEKLLSTLSKKLTSDPQVQAQFRFLTAKAQLNRRQYQQAVQTLSYPTHWQLPRWQWQNYYQQKANIYAQLQQPFEQIRQLSLLSTFESKQNVQHISDQIWQALQPVKQDQLTQATQQTNDPIYNGWLQLAFIAKHYGADPMQLISYLSRWQKKHNTHPAAYRLPSDLEKAINTKPYQPKKIAVLLPLTGDKADLANPIRAGIVSRYLSELNSQVSLNFYDTHLGVEVAYQQAIDAGSDFLIGPLLPKNLDALTALQLQNKTDKVIPQLFLNQLDKATEHNDQYYFSLSPQQEAVDAANYLFKDGIRTPLIFATNNPVGHRMANAFNQQWQALHNTAAEIHYYNASKMQTTVQDAMGVKDSLNRIGKMKSLISRKLKADFRSRRDIDGLYLISGASDLPLLKPFIDVNFSVFVKPLPIYAINRGRPNDLLGRAAIEFNGITMSDSPWLMRNTPKLREVDGLWPNWNNSQLRLFAMGHDALELINKLAQMRAFPGFHLRGYSGTLSIEPSGVIKRQLQWGKFDKGYLKPL